MLEMVATLPVSTVPTWMVQVEAGLTPPGPRTPSVDELEPMVELMYRTGGVHSAVVTPRLGGMAVAMCLGAPDATEAMERARALAVSSARYAGFGLVTVDRVEVAPRTGPATS